MSRTSTLGIVAALVAAVCVVVLSLYAIDVASAAEEDDDYAADDWPIYMSDVRVCQWQPNRVLQTMNCTDWTPREYRSEDDCLWAEWEQVQHQTMLARMVGNKTAASVVCRQEYEA